MLAQILAQGAMQAPEPEHCVLLEDLAAVRSFWVAPWALEPYVATAKPHPQPMGRRGRFCAPNTGLFHGLSCKPTTCAGSSGARS